MYVDPRVAHARAKIQLSERAIDPVSVVAPVCRTIQRGLQDILDRGMSGRSMHRHLHGPVVSALSRLGVHAWIDEEDSDVYGFCRSKAGWTSKRNYYVLLMK
jgi:hypothetical protein